MGFSEAPCAALFSDQPSRKGTRQVIRPLPVVLAAVSPRTRSNIFASACVIFDSPFRQVDW